MIKERDAEQIVKPCPRRTNQLPAKIAPRIPSTQRRRHGTPCAITSPRAGGIGFCCHWVLHQRLTCGKRTDLAIANCAADGGPASGGVAGRAANDPGLGGACCAGTYPEGQLKNKPAADAAFQQDKAHGRNSGARTG